MGTDHTLYAVEKGWVRFYQPHPDPSAMIKAEAETPESIILRQAMSGLAISPLRQETALPISEPLRGHPSSPRRRTGRRYVGVVLNQDDVLPYPLGQPRERRFGLVNIRQTRIQDIPQMVDSESTVV
jgi:hypothetical protein